MFSIVNCNSAWKNCSFVSSLLHNIRHECGNCICAACIFRELCVLAENSVIHSIFFFYPRLPPSWCDGPRNIETPFLFQKKREQGNSRLMWRKQHFGKKSFNNSCRICLKLYKSERNEMGKEIIRIPTTRSFKQHAAVCKTVGKHCRGNILLLQWVRTPWLLERFWEKHFMFLEEASRVRCVKENENKSFIFVILFLSGL